MNYLAHLYLADPTPDSLLGNLIADFVKGRDVATLSEAIQSGILMHRQVDRFTDCHPVVQRSICRISKKWGWFSGILIDVYYDHILALNWERWSAEPLRSFVDRVHVCLHKNIDLVPAVGEPLLRLIASDRLFSYRSSEGIAEALMYLSRRIEERMPGKNIQLQDAMPDLRDCHGELTGDFQEFFPTMIAFVEELRAKAGG